MEPADNVEQPPRRMTRTHMGLLSVGGGIALGVENGWPGSDSATLFGTTAGVLMFAVGVVVLLAAHGGRLAAPYPYWTMLLLGPATTWVAWFCSERGDSKRAH